MKQKMLYLPEKIADALRKGAFATEQTQHQFVLKAILVSLRGLKRDDINDLLDQYEAERQNNEEKTNI